MRWDIWKEGFNDPIDSVEYYDLPYVESLSTAANYYARGMSTPKPYAFHNIQYSPHGSRAFFCPVVFLPIEDPDRTGLMNMMPPMTCFAVVVDGRQRNANGEAKRTRMWFQRDLFDDTNSILHGDPSSSLYVDRMSRIGQMGAIDTWNWTSDMVAQVSVALDSFLQTGVTDPRFI